MTIVPWEQNPHRRVRPMAPDRLASLLDRMGMSARALSRQTGLAHTTVLAWLRGDRNTPKPVAEWLERRAAEWERDPPPHRDFGHEH